MFYINEIVNINKKFAKGIVMNKSSLEFALSSIKTKAWIDQIAYLVRAILLDHVFEDGNKRTAAVIIIIYFTELEIGFDPQKIAEIILNIITKNINDINKIKRMIKNVIR
ncbi:Fic family protein [Candidatus Woesearchaeota archaeon]|nr:Fic family protein [Candidatus Woesearchaeota archaeon]